MASEDETQPGPAGRRRSVEQSEPRRGERFRSSKQLRQPRLAEMVAASLRSEILSGRLREGDSLPRQDDLLADFKVSPPAVREALRILETEGLISVRRGNVGGAVVHFPTARGVAYMVSLVLHAQKTSLADVGAALRHLEPLCAALCAARPDRKEVIVPRLEAIVNQQVEAIRDVAAYNRAARAFHETLVASCGNETMILVVGALESLWSTHEHHVYDVGPEPSLTVRRSALRAHERLAAAIAAGNVDTATQIARRHLDATQAFTMSTEDRHDIDAELVRDIRLG